jgi:hypothetical protein
MEYPKSDLRIETSQAEAVLFRLLVEYGGCSSTLDAFLAYKGISKSEIAREMDVDMSMINKYWRTGAAPLERIRQLRALGIPSFLLPKVSGRSAKFIAHGMKKQAEVLP